MRELITKDELWNFSIEKIAALTKGRVIRIVLNDGRFIDVYIKNLLGASTPPHEFCGFITSDNHTIYLQVINHVELI